MFLQQKYPFLWFLHNFQWDFSLRNVISENKDNNFVEAWCLQPPVSRVKSHMSHITKHFLNLFFSQNCEASGAQVCCEKGLHCLVFDNVEKKTDFKMLP